MVTMRINSMRAPDSVSIRNKTDEVIELKILIHTTYTNEVSTK